MTQEERDDNGSTKGDARRKDNRHEKREEHHAETQADKQTAAEGTRENASTSRRPRETTKHWDGRGGEERDTLLLFILFDFILISPVCTKSHFPHRGFCEASGNRVGPRVTGRTEEERGGRGIALSTPSIGRLIRF